MLQNLISYHDNFSKHKNSIGRQPSGLPRLNYVCLCWKLRKMTPAFILFPKEMAKNGDFLIKSWAIDNSANTTATVLWLYYTVMGSSIDVVYKSEGGKSLA